MHWLDLYLYSYIFIVIYPGSLPWVLQMLEGSWEGPDQAWETRDHGIASVRCYW